MYLRFANLQFLENILLKSIDNADKMMYNEFIVQKEQALRCQVRDMHVIYLLLALLEVRVLPL
jgi:hypothetical protein